MRQRYAQFWAGFVFICVLAITCVSAAQQQTLVAEDLQQQAAAQGGNETLRLRTYVNRIQIPTLVLARNRTPVSGLDSSSFSITLDSGPAFHPTHSRIEGDDPLSLSILIDASGSQPELTSKLADALALLVPDSLHATDHISIFSADCKMFRTRLYKPADSQDIQLAVKQALTAVRSPSGKKQVHCGETFHLWDFAMYMFGQTGDLPGRRVALIISGGHESKSGASLTEAARFAARHAISVFGLRDRSELDYRGTNALGGFSDVRTGGRNEDPFEILCASSGGVVFDLDFSGLAGELAHFLQCVRSRYILEFPRPDHGDPGLHEVSVTVPTKKRLLVRAAGASAASADPNLANDPTVVPSQASPAVFGNRRPIDATKH